MQPASQSTIRLVDSLMEEPTEFGASLVLSGCRHKKLRFAVTEGERERERERERRESEKASNFPRDPTLAASRLAVHDCLVRWRRRRQQQAVARHCVKTYDHLSPGQGCYILRRASACILKGSKIAPMTGVGNRQKHDCIRSTFPNPNQSLMPGPQLFGKTLLHL